MADLSPPLQNSSVAGEPPEVEKVLKWQQERKAKLLRGEYESAIVHLSEIINTNLDRPLRLSSVQVTGATTTRDAFLQSLVKPLLPEPSRSTLSDVLASSRAISDRLLNTDIFSSVSASIEPSASPLASPEDIDLVVKTREKGRFFLKSSTEVGNNEGNASLTGRMRNVFGGAEVVEGNVSLGTTTKRAFNASFSAPLSPDLRTRGELGVYGLESDLTAWSSCACAVRGLRATIRRDNHEFSYEAALRNIGNLTPNASLFIRQSAGPSFKGSLSHTYTLSSYLGSSTAAALHLKIKNELAGFGGDTSFFKQEFDGRVESELGHGFSLSLGTRTGILLPSGPVQFPDRFHLGGPLSVRAFKTNGMGIRDGSDSVGGTLYYSTGLSLLMPIPRKPDWPLKVHSWINAGLLSDPFSDGLSTEKIVNQLSRPSVSAGIGLVWNLPLSIPSSSPFPTGPRPEKSVRMELNFGVPLVMAKNELARRGVQVGIGVEFL